MFASWIIRLLYGMEYGPAAGLLRLVVWYTTFAHLGLVRDIWILSKEKQSVLWKINIFGALTNVALNFILIPQFGAMGAAAASLATQFAVNTGACFVLKSLRGSGKLMLRSMDPRYIGSLLKREYSHEKS